jgi:hypothetical protein
MRHPEKLSVGLTGIRAEGQLTTAFVMLLITAALGLGFATGKMSAVIDACFGLRPF